MTGGLSKNYHGVGIGPLSKILAVNGNINSEYQLCTYRKRTYNHEQLIMTDFTYLDEVITTNCGSINVPKIPLMTFLEIVISYFF